MGESSLALLSPDSCISVYLKCLSIIPDEQSSASFKIKKNLC